MIRRAAACFTVAALATAPAAHADTLDDLSPEGQAWMTALLIDTTSRVLDHEATVRPWATLTLDAFGSVRLAGEALCVMAYESGGDPLEHGPPARTPENPNAVGQPVGLMQIQSDDMSGEIVHAYESIRVKTEAEATRWLEVPANNLRAARLRVDADGWAPWETAPFCGL